MSKELLQTPQSLIALAIENKSSVEQLEKLMELQNKWEAKEAKKHFFDAMTKFQSEKPDIQKDKKADYGGGKAKYNWSSLNTIQKAIDPILSKYGLSYSFETVQTEKHLTISCIVSHSLGHTKKTSLTALHDTSGGKNSVQALGSTNSYLRRYTLCNAFGISADEDNDGKTAQRNIPEKLSEKDIKVLKGKIATCTTKQQLTNLWYSNDGYKTNKEVVKLFTERQLEIQQS